MKWTTTLAGLVCAIGSVVSHTIFSGGCDFNIEFRKSDFDFIAMTLESVEFCFFLNYVQIILKYFHYIMIPIHVEYDIAICATYYMLLLTHVN